jgi:crotonobetainyl-CoA:carnitine CoA-transferase CaiB-like acyl-CoA transferase
MFDLLKGVRVVECAVLFNGDQTGRLLGDLGADVIKVESPGVGDYLRDFLGQITPHNSPAHLYVNRNKRSMTLDLRSEAGRAIFFELIATADIFVDGFAGDACEQLGIGYEAQRAVNPRIIYAQCSGFGAKGPLSSIPTHGQMMGALGGGAFLAVDKDGIATETGGLSDGTVVGATNTALTALAAVIRQRATGQGCYIDGAGSDAVLATQWMFATIEWNNDRLTERDSLPSMGGPPQAKYHYYQTKDEKFILFCCIESKFWKAFCRATGRDDLTDVDNAGHTVDFGGRHAGLTEVLRDIFLTKTQAQWVQLAIDHDIAMGPANLVKDLRDEPQLAARNMINEEVHPDAGPFSSVGWPTQISDQEFSVWQPAPRLGQHTAELLTELGRSAVEIEALQADRVV